MMVIGMAPDSVHTAPEGDKCMNATYEYESIYGDCSDGGNGGDSGNERRQRR